jgi:hypothetical protein
LYTVKESSECETLWWEDTAGRKGGLQGGGSVLIRVLRKEVRVKAELGMVGSLKKPILPLRPHAVENGFLKLCISCVLMYKLVPHVH